MSSTQQQIRTASMNDKVQFFLGSCLTCPCAVHAFLPGKGIKPVRNRWLAGPTGRGLGRRLSFSLCEPPVSQKLLRANISNSLAWKATKGGRGGGGARICNVCSSHVFSSCRSAFCAAPVWELVTSVVTTFSSRKVWPFAKENRCAREKTYARSCPCAVAFRNFVPSLS